ncbi:hypothetical protein Raf01_08860 [Rugosimonospora africana]|uniref:Uncharacterized protein n=1 Tax=Rugosimonospora africana TaxID=556532 RepID=A0A8J3VMY9_9ACTN|nr:hypothetical protein Raf01_08860 [Rugosimonospora africana]
MTRGDYQREQRQMRRRIRELLAQRRTVSAGGDITEPPRTVTEGTTGMPAA